MQSKECNKNKAQAIKDGYRPKLLPAKNTEEGLTPKKQRMFGYVKYVRNKNMDEDTAKAVRYANALVYRVCQS